MIDAHVHTPPRIALGNQRLFALLYLANGVTSIRDVGQSETSIRDFAEGAKSGQFAGPYVYRCGPVLDGPDPGWPAARQVLTPDEARQAIRALAAEGVDCIKLYNHIGLPVFEAVIAEAKRLKLPVIGHVPHQVGLRRTGRYESQHLTGIPYVRKAPRWQTDVDCADIAAMTEAEIEEALALVKAGGGSLTPTIINQRMRLSATDPKRFPPPPATRELPGFWNPVWSALVSHPESAAEIKAQLDSIVMTRRISGRARELGIDVLAGTDVLMPYVNPGEGLLLEIAELARAFGSNEAALEAATRVNGRHIAPGRIGEVAPGFRADLLLMTRDPTADLRALRSASHVMTAGRLYDRRRLATWQSQYRAHFHSGLYARLMGGVAALAAGGSAANAGR